MPDRDLFLRRIDWAAASEADRAGALARPVAATREALSGSVASIIRAVRENGDAALLEFARKFDGVELGSLRVSAGAFDEAEAALSAEQNAAIRDAIANVRA